MYVTPAATCYGNINPSFRVFEVALATHEIVNMYTYRMNLTDANTSGVPKWTLAYDARSEYDMTDMSAASWDLLAKKLRTNETLANKFWVHKYQGNPPGPCNAACRKYLSCHLMSITPEKYKACMNAPAV